MSPLLRKEIRLLLPFWGIALALAVVPVFATPVGEWWRVNDSCFWLFAFGLTLLGLAPFGQEFGWGTLSIMLAQPLERSRIWKTKCLLLLAAGGVVLVAFAICVHMQLTAGLQSQVEYMFRIHKIDAAKAAELASARSSEFAPALVKALALMLMALTGGLWTTLLFRQTGAALWFAILIPGVLLVVVEGIFHAASNTTTEIAVDLILFFYAIAGFVGARRMFARAQDSQWLGENIAMLSLKSTKVHDDSAVPRRKAAIRALLRKEFQSHQISLLIAFGLLVLHICTLIFRGVYVLPKNSEFRFTVEAVPLLWLLVPWLMGCVAIAEERKLGTMESQLCLPVNRRVQFAMKLIVVLVLGVILGGVMPALVEGIGTCAGVSSQIVNAMSAPGGGTYFASTIELVIGAGLIALVSFFASSLTRNTLHALGAAIVFSMAWVFLFSLLHGETLRDFHGYTLWKGPLILWVSAACSIIATIGLSFSNYKRLHAGGRAWLRNAAILAGTLVFAGLATAFVYQRPWELTMSLEPQHGAPVLSGAVRPAVYMPSGRICALLPDGRIWISADYQMQYFDQVQEAPNDGEAWAGKAAVPANGTFVGSNWVALAANDQVMNVDAIRADGTLWSLLSYADVTNSRSPYRWLDAKPTPRRIGSGSDWKAVASIAFGFMGVKSNGTLWQWQDFLRDPSRNKPVQVGSDSDWEDVFSAQWRAMSVKRDGSVWTPPMPGGVMGVNLFRRPKWNGADWLQVSGENGQFLLIKRDGSLWEGDMGRFDEIGLPRYDQQSPPGPIRLGSDSDWNAISGSPDEFVAIKGGRLLKRDYVPFTKSLGRPSKYSDWLAIDGSQDRMLALAADGTLCLWNDMPASRLGFEWLARSRRPFWSLNILTSVKE